MRILFFLIVILSLASCRLSIDTRVADHPGTRLAIINSVKLGQTTPSQLIARWGHPFQKSNEGGRVDYIYRSAGTGEAGFVIVRFEYNLAIDVMSTETDPCRAQFSPRIPGYDWATLRVVKPMATCLTHSDGGGGYVPGVVADRYIPQAGNAK